MQSLIYLVLAGGCLPFLIGILRLGRAAADTSVLPRLGSVLACTLAFNLIFFWQELWLVIPKAVAGLSPVLFHNDHDWATRAPIADLLQGTGALATFASGLVALALLALRRTLPATWRLFVFWLAFQGLFQALTQLAVGTLLPGNDVGRALAWLGATAIDKSLLRGASIVAMMLAGAVLAALAPAGLGAPGVRGTRAFAWALLLTAVGCVVLSVPLREPRELVEVVLIPAVVNLLGVGWMVFGARRRRAGPPDVAAVPGVAGPAMALVALLLVFQLVLRPGVHF